jgi:hypothetical protein
VRAISVSTLTLCLVSAAYAQQGDNGAGQLKLQLMKTTQVVAVADYSGSPDKFAEDNDPNTLQIVFLAKPEFGPSRVSDDGEVIFLAPVVTDDEQSSLIDKAFDIRVQRRLAGKKSN